MKITHLHNPIRVNLPLPAFWTVMLFSPSELDIVEQIILGIMEMDIDQEGRESLQRLYDVIRSPQPQEIN